MTYLYRFALHSVFWLLFLSPPPPPKNKKNKIKAPKTLHENKTEKAGKTKKFNQSRKRLSGSRMVV